jgi:hypothetical protein
VPIAKSTVTLWSASAGAPKQLAKVPQTAGARHKNELHPCTGSYAALLAANDLLTHSSDCVCIDDSRLQDVAQSINVEGGLRQRDAGDQQEQVAAEGGTPKHAWMSAGIPTNVGF